MSPAQNGPTPQAKPPGGGGSGRPRCGAMRTTRRGACTFSSHKSGSHLDGPVLARLHEDPPPNAVRSRGLSANPRRKTTVVAPARLLAPRGWRRLLACAFAALLFVLLLSLRAPAAPAPAPAAVTAQPHGMAMQMSFYWGTGVTLWFEGWTTRGPGEYVLALAGLAALCAVQEAVHTWRAHAAAGNARTSGRSNSAALEAALYGVHVLCSYLLMLAVMSFNGGVLLTVVAGMAASRFLLARPRSGSSGTLPSTPAQRGGALASEREPLLDASHAANTADACCAPNAVPAAALL